MDSLGSEYDIAAIAFNKIVLEKNKNKTGFLLHKNQKFLIQLLNDGDFDLAKELVSEYQDRNEIYLLGISKDDFYNFIMRSDLQLELSVSFLKRIGVNALDTQAGQHEIINHYVSEIMNGSLVAAEKYDEYYKLEAKDRLEFRKNKFGSILSSHAEFIIRNNPKTSLLFGLFKNNENFFNVLDNIANDKFTHGNIMAPLMLKEYLSWSVPEKIKYKSLLKI